ncbi:MAG: YkgJ family cysteine cluster protein [Bdellovibrionales bacterium]|nr:YkgJ family cysteine cluster protein [Bdellovibrionales bacterium]MBT3524703.1 YkgJ family cysteine cluster protein [Bdellovibrionales bacterium]MBT7767971.1 YkgJ family cysteine cluster protein [Bdellovibrionales bacterium]
MSFPIIAFSTYLKNLNQPKLIKITKTLLKKLYKTTSAKRRARLVHQVVDSEMKDLFNDCAVKKFVRCGDGCAHCCYSHVAITSDEADLLAHRVMEQGVEINYTRLQLQQKAGDSIEAWNQIPHSMRRCVLLDQSDSCMVYSDRPSTCRINNVVSEPELCRLDQGERPISLLLTERADMAMIAHYIYSKQSKKLVTGTIPQLLWQSLHQKSEQVSSPSL